MKVNTIHLRTTGQDLERPLTICFTIHMPVIQCIRQFDKKRKEKKMSGDTLVQKCTKSPTQVQSIRSFKNRK